MEVNVKVTIELGANTIAALTGGLISNGTPKAVAAAPAKAAPVAKVEEVKEEAVVKTMPAAAPKAAPAPAPAVKPAAPKAATPAPAAKPAPKPAAPAAAATDFADMDEDAQLEAIKVGVTRHTKKGKSADIKALLSNFGAGRASELTPDQYVDFNDAIVRYSAGETVEEIYPSLD